MRDMNTPFLSAMEALHLRSHFHQMARILLLPAMTRFACGKQTSHHVNLAYDGKLAIPTGFSSTEKLL